MDKLTDILDVAAGNRDLSIAIDMASIAMLVFGFFVAMLLALVIQGLLFN